LDSINTSTIKEIKIARDIVQEVRNYGVNDNIICMIVEQLSLDLTDFQLMKELRDIASKGSSMTNLKEIGMKEMDKVQQELMNQNTGDEYE